MDYKTQQRVFDDEKWYDSVQAGNDQCGTYAFCGVCDKAEEFPCARAVERFQKANVPKKYVRIATVRWGF